MTTATSEPKVVVWNNEKALAYARGRIRRGHDTDFSAGDVVNSAWLMWRSKQLLSEPDAPIYWSIGACLYIALKRLRAEQRKHRNKITKHSARYVAKARVYRPYTGRQLRHELQDIGLSPKQRKLTSLILAGYTPTMCATTLKVSAGRVTQLLASITQAYADDKPRKTPRKRLRLRIVKQHDPSEVVPYAHEENSIVRVSPFKLEWPIRD